MSFGRELDVNRLPPSGPRLTLLVLNGEKDSSAVQIPKREGHIPEVEEDPHRAHRLVGRHSAHRLARQHLKISGVLHGPVAL